MNKKAFTLAELLAVIVIIGVLIGIAIPSYNRYIKKTRESVYQSYINKLEDAAKTYVTEMTYHNGNITSHLTYSDLKNKYLTPFDNSKDSCSFDDSYVDITETNIGGVKNYTYAVCLKCNGNKVSAEGNNCN